MSPSGVCCLPDRYDCAGCSRGSAHGPITRLVSPGDLAVFEDQGGAIEFTAQTDAAFVLGSGVRHPHELFMGPYSVHTSAEALHRGQTGIRERAQLLRQQGRM